MKLAHSFASALLFVFTISLSAATPRGKTQQLTSPNQVPDGLAKSDWQSIRAAYEAGRHAFRPTGGGWQARNPGQQWITKFDGRGFMTEPKDGAWRWGLELKSYGFTGAERVIDGVPAVKADGQRLVYGWDTTVQEWFVNDARGLEHGFTVRERPKEKHPTSNIPHPTSNEGIGRALAPWDVGCSVLDIGGSAPLSFTLAVRGSLRPHITADSKGVEFRDAAGTTVLTYAGLKVWDADGHALPARFEPLATRHSPLVITLSVDERGARYPLTIDPIAQQVYLKPGAVGSNQALDSFGFSVSISGDTVIVGAPFEDSNTTGVNTIPNDSGGTFDSGAAYVFVRNAGVWTQQAYLKPAAPVGASQAGDEFGFSVAISGNTVVVGAPFEPSSTTGVNPTPNEGAISSGAAYVFTRSGTTWTQQAFLKPGAVGTTQVGDHFGWSVSISGDTLVIGAESEDSSTTGAPNESASDAGAAYVFTRSGSTWMQQAYLKAAVIGTTQAGDHFGRAVAVSGDNLVVGAHFEASSSTGVNSTPNESANSAGAAYVFTRSGTTWTQEAYLKPAAVGTTQANDFFGSSVAVSGETVIVGAPGEASSTTGVNSTPNESANSAGAVYVFTGSGATWTQQAYLKPAAVGTTQAGDLFGASVAISGDMLVVGASAEASSTTGINSTPNESASSAGAAYVFVRSAGVWTQQAYLKPGAVGTSQAGDRFGWSAGISGDTAIIGAIVESSSTTGVNSTPNESAFGSGAAYLFAGIGPVPDADGDGLLDSWELTYWPTTTGHSAQDDFDGDGYEELLELALGLNPTSPDPGGLPPVTDQGGYLTMTLTKHPGVLYEVQSAGTLVPMQPDSFSAATTTVLITDATTLKVRDNFLIATTPIRYMRLKVTAAP